MRASRFAWVGIALGGALAATPALAAEGGQLGATPWFPLVDEEKGPAETFELNTLGIIRSGDEGWRANRGKYRSLLSRHDFYVTVGRTDLARHDAASAATSSVFFWSGCASVGLGVVLFYAHVSPGGVDPGVKAPLFFALGGAAAIYTSTFFSGPSVSPEEAEEMAQRYNERLKAHIERGGDDDKPKPVQALAPRVVPWTDGRSAGGLMALATF